MGFKDFMRGLKVRVFGPPKLPIIRTTTPLRKMRRKNQGPNDRRYVRRMFPQSVFTQKITPSRRKTIRDVMRTLRPDQLAVVYRLGWNKGVIV